MSIGVIIAIVVVVAVLLVVAVVAGRASAKKARSKKLQQSFGPEYDRALEQHGDKKAAEQQLEQRQERRSRFETRPLEPEQQQHFASEWRNVQGRFVDHPQQAVRESDHLIKEVMRQRGYPVDDFEQRSDDISVDHPHVVENYRSASAIAQRNEQGQASTEDLRQATVHYRALFEELVETQVGGRHASGQGQGPGGEHGQHGAGHANQTGATGRQGEEVR